MEILGVPVVAQTLDDAVVRLLEAARVANPIRAHFATVHSVVEAQSNAPLLEVFRTSPMVCTDGMPLVWVARMRGLRAARVCGPDVLLALSDRGRAQDLRHYFVGGASGVADQLATNLTSRFPGIKIVGTESPPFRHPTLEEDEALVARVNMASPDVVWVGLGSPKQEFWAADHAAQLKAPLLLPVGAAFDFYGGSLRRAPRWLQRMGLEWLYRLLSEPRRLWRRYLVTNTRFVWLVLKEEVARRRTRTDQEA